jgi:hypothetical protein
MTDAERQAYFNFDHLPEHLRDISRPFCVLAELLAARDELHGPEVDVALRKLLEAKDAAVRSALVV